MTYFMGTPRFVLSRWPLRPGRGYVGAGAVPSTPPIMPVGFVRACQHGRVQVRWVWAFVDMPEQGFGERLDFWRGVTRTTLSPWRGDHDQFVTLVPESGDAWLKAQRVGGTGGVHVDLDVDVPLDRARQRAVGLGATVVNELDDVVVCRSPGGFGFCLTRWDRQESTAGQVRAGQDNLLDQVCLDIPSQRYGVEMKFWSALTGWSVEPGDVVDEFERLSWRAELPVRFLLQRLDDSDGRVRAHLDFAAVDRADEVARQVAMGATRVRDGRGWTVLRDPGGMEYCVTDRHPRAQ